MTISKLYEAGIINDDTKITVRNSHFVIVAAGNWFNDNIQDYINKELESFSWQDNNKVFAYLKEVCE